MDKTVGIVGLGIMGGAIARNLIERGWKVVGFDTDAIKCTELAQARVVIASGVDEVARATDIIMTSLPTPAAVADVAHGIANSGQPPRIVLELSTLAIADKLRFESILTKAGHIALDCPLSGTGAQAKNRDLIVYASGDSEAIARCAPLFADFAKQSADLGAFGNGSRMKFIANHLVAINNVATAEAMILAQRAGLDPQMVVDMVGPGAGGSRMFQMRAPMMVEGVYEPATMKVSTWKKDMAIIAEFADDVGCATPLFTLTQPVYTEAMAMGLGDQDTAAVFEVLKKTIIRERNPAANSYLKINHPLSRRGQTMKIGVCGTGRMGSSIAQRLMSVGHEAGVWNRDPAKTKPLTEAGAKLFASPAELVEGCDVVIVMLLNDAATEAVYRGPGRILEAKLAGKLVIDMSTVRPDTMKSVGTAVLQQGAGFVECPVGGSTGPAKEGKLFGLVGGSNADVARAKPLLEQLCRRIEHVGDLGAGATMKLAVNLPLLVYWQALGEALTICKPLDLPAERLIDILSDTAGTPAAMKGRGAVIAKVLGGAPLGETAFGLNAATKDLATAVRFAESIHAELPVTASALACFEEAEAEGLGDADATTIAVRWTQRPASKS